MESDPEDLVLERKRGRVSRQEEDDEGGMDEGKRRRMEDSLVEESVEQLFSLKKNRAERPGDRHYKASERNPEKDRIELPHVPKDDDDILWSAFLYNHILMGMLLRIFNTSQIRQGDNVCMEITREGVYFRFMGKCLMTAVDAFLECDVHFDDEDQEEQIKVTFNIKELLIFLQSTSDRRYLDFYQKKSEVNMVYFDMNYGQLGLKLIGIPTMDDIGDTQGKIPQLNRLEANVHTCVITSHASLYQNVKTGKTWDRMQLDVIETGQQQRDHQAYKYVRIKFENDNLMMLQNSPCLTSQHDNLDALNTIIPNILENTTGDLSQPKFYTPTIPNPPFFNPNVLFEVIQHMSKEFNIMLTFLKDKNLILSLNFGKERVGESYLRILLASLIEEK